MAIIPKTKATILKINAFTVISHHVSSNDSNARTLTKKMETTIASKKKAFNPTDHLPERVFGKKFVIMLLFYYFDGLSVNKNPCLPVGRCLLKLYLNYIAFQTFSYPLSTGVGIKIQPALFDEIRAFLISWNKMQ